ncbi:ABC transporter permease [Nonomuraea spiralis]|uniref:ABC transporter permease n=1 Tax=Nonomuraea spiralis TaxID=46182 RepID=A0ABV5IUI7_9ACTN|nr:FtsX-like permease family protein [Nonomuraea spiralis]GGS90467.1 ABC transporter substrate-binding protein [Nonomuraea spiralis]
MFVALRDLRFAKGRFALMGTVVFLITLLVTMLSGLTAGLARENVSAVEGLPAAHLVFDGAEKPAFADSRITDRTWQDWRQVAGDAVERLGVSMSRLAYGDERSTAAALFGVQPGGALAQGRPVGAGGIVLSTALATGTGLKSGDTLQIAGEDFTVSGIGDEASYSHTPVAWIEIGDWQRMARRGDAATVATVLALTTDAPTSPNAADLDAADARIGTTTVPLSEAPAAIGSFSSENGSLQLMRGFLFAISALVIGAFFTVWTIQRRGDVAVLKALGASTGYLLRDALAQAVVVLLAGAAAGGLLGAGLGALAEGTVPFVLSAATTVVPVAVLVLLGAAGAALAIRKITSVDPLTALGASR